MSAAAIHMVQGWLGCPSWNMTPEVEADEKPVFHRPPFLKTENNIRDRRVMAEKIIRHGIYFSVKITHLYRNQNNLHLRLWSQPKKSACLVAGLQVLSQFCLGTVQRPPGQRWFLGHRSFAAEVLARNSRFRRHLPTFHLPAKIHSVPGR